VVRGAEDSRPKGREFRYRRILDGAMFTFYIHWKEKNKGSQMWHTEK
jgi:hypothetical protein